MTKVDHPLHPLSRPSETPGFLRRIGGFFRDFAAITRAAHEAERLLGCSDAELERRGLDRSEVVPHVFKTYLARG